MEAKITGCPSWGAKSTLRPLSKTSRSSTDPEAGADMRATMMAVKNIMEKTMINETDESDLAIFATLLIKNLI
jgi:hypothetical protein